MENWPIHFLNHNLSLSLAIHDTHKDALCCAVGVEFGVGVEFILLCRIHVKNWVNEQRRNFPLDVHLLLILLVPLIVPNGFVQLIILEAFGDLTLVVAPKMGVHYFKKV